MPEESSLAKVLAIVGDEDIVLGFEGVGFKSYTIKESQEFKIVLGEVVKEKIAVCLVQDNFYQAHEEEINYYRHLPLPIFVPFSKDTKKDLLNSLIKLIRIKTTGAFS